MVNQKHVQKMCKNHIQDKVVIKCEYRCRFQCSLKRTQHNQTGDETLKNLHYQEPVSTSVTPAEYVK